MGIVLMGHELEDSINECKMGNEFHSGDVFYEWTMNGIPMGSERNINEI